MSTRVLHVAEPPPRFHVRTPIVVDCSVLAAAVFQEDEEDAAQTQLEMHELHAPYLLQSELANVALKKLRQGFEDTSRDGLQRAVDMGIDLHSVDMMGVASLANRFRLTAYDASYLWLAAELRAPLVTFDARLAGAARECLGSLG